MNTMSLASKSANNQLVQDVRSLPEKFRLIDSRLDIPDEQTNKMVSRSEAYDIQSESGLDLILISNTNDQCVVKLMDYGKFCYKEQKRDKRQAQQQRGNNKGIKEYYFGPLIGDHDFQTKMKQIRKKLDQGFTVRVGVKNSRQTRASIPRNQTLSQAARDSNFVVRRVMDELGETIVSGGMKIATQSVFVDLKKLRDTDT